MKSPRLRALVSLVLIACMTLALLPLGCSSVKLRHYPGEEGRPRLPAATEQGLTACMEQLKDNINAGFYSVDAKVEVNEDGDIVDVQTEGMPDPEVGICMRLALRHMTIPEDVLEQGLLGRTAAANGQAMPDRRQTGEVVTIVVITIVFTEIVIEAVAVSLAVGVTATVAAGAAEAVRRRRQKKEEDKSCEGRYATCMGTPTGDEEGNHWRQSRCAACLRKCRVHNEWPEQLNAEQSCIYPGFKW